MYSTLYAYIWGVSVKNLQGGSWELRQACLVLLSPHPPSPPGIFPGVDIGIWGLDALPYDLTPQHIIIQHSDAPHWLHSSACGYCTSFQNTSPWDSPPLGGRCGYSSQRVCLPLGLCQKSRSVLTPFFTSLGSPNDWQCWDGIKTYLSGFYLQVSLCSSVGTTVLLFWIKIYHRSFTSTKCFYL